MYALQPVVITPGIRHLVLLAGTRDVWHRLVRRRYRNDTLVVVLHGDLLSVPTLDARHAVWTPLDFLADEQIPAFGAARADLLRAIQDSSPRLGCGSHELMIEYARPIKDFSSPAIASCFDLSALVNTIALQLLGRPLTIELIAGGAYEDGDRLTLAFAAHLLSHRCSAVVPVKFTWATHTGDTSYSDVAQFIERVVDSAAPPPGTDPVLEAQMVRMPAHATVLFAGSLRYPDYWRDWIRRNGLDCSSIVTFVTDYFDPWGGDRGLHVHSLRAAAAKGAAIFGWLDDIAYIPEPMLRSRVGPVAESEAIYRLFVTHYIPALAERVLTDAHKLERLFAGTQITRFFATNEAQLEMLALMVLCGRRSVKPILLPHSFYSTHDAFASGSYERAYSFFRSSEIRKHFFDAEYDGRQEMTVPLPPVLPAEWTAVNHYGRASGFLRRLSADFIRPLKTRVNSLQRVIVQRRLMHKVRSQANGMRGALALRADRLAGTLLQLRNSGKRHLHVGVLLDCEHYRFSSTTSTARLAAWLAMVAARLKVPRTDQRVVFTLHVKAKTVFTSALLLRSLFRKQARADLQHLVHFVSGSTPVLQFADQVDVVIVPQLGSGVLQLMAQGVPCVRLHPTDLPAMIVADPFLVPEDVLQEVTIADLIARVVDRPTWLDDIGSIQSAWARAHMA